MASWGWTNPGLHPTWPNCRDKSSSSSWFRTNDQKHQARTHNTSSSNCLVTKYNVLLSRVLRTEHMNVGNRGLLLVPCMYRDRALLVEKLATTVWFSTFKQVV
ncbi:hypothetical protein I3843_05G122200 [Carya illinoinensis]|uniref:Uncharacterized protein n=1 Tax=Carya illinoinensis TaxID=32201 RepID=A0A922EZF2_CARIL|nr:hypothetical protein I3842_05G129300 [Carya illinoinensis]KAG7979276.1 hypothetical protein I3843_05G122200 [Carya illinoinensis]